MADNYYKKLTPKEILVAGHARLGKLDKEIASDLDLSVYTVKFHLKNIYSKLGVNGKSGLARLLIPTENIYENNPVEGLWLSQFKYKSWRPTIDDYVDGIQYDIEFITSNINDTSFPFSGENLLFGGSLKNCYHHKIKCFISRKNLIGIWMNEENNQNIGCFQLSILNNTNMMMGMHLGNASNNSIQPGEWTWIKIGQSGAIDPDNFSNQYRLHNFDTMDKLFHKLLYDYHLLDLDYFIKPKG